MTKKRCNQCIKYEVLHTLCEKCKELNDFNALLDGDAVELPKIDMGVSVSVPEREALWSEDEEKRQEVVNQNGNDGFIYDLHGDIWEVK